MSLTRGLPEDSLAAQLLQASAVVCEVMDHGRSLSELMTVLENPAQRAAVQDLSYTTVRNWGLAYALVSELTGGKVLKPAQLRYLLATSLALAADPSHERYEPHTLVNQAVLAADSQRETRAGKGLINACLRRFYREREALLAKALQNPTARWGFPRWWIDKLKQQQAQRWQQVLEAAQGQPPLVLRVNRRRSSVERFVDACSAAGLEAHALSDQAVYLPNPVPVSRIPGFAQGHVSVQDLAAQWAAPLLDVRDGMRVLDACCAPGGKTGHLLECADIDLLALDVDDYRLQRVAENLQRLGLLTPRVHLQAADAADLSAWWDGQPFDAILADVPCTGSGVTRRHPDIRWLRRQADVAAMSQLQTKLLDVLWSVLKPGGTLLVVTCSIFGEEGEQLLARFMGQHPEAAALPAPGLVLPERQADGPGHDGFFYAKLQKPPLAQA
jgi:16S rRNA (cytosine967-C5)-methyltransferase